MKCNDSKNKNSKYNNNTLHKYVNALRGRKFKCDEKDLFDKRMFLHVDNSNNNECKKTRNHLPSIDVTRHTFTNNNINNSNTITVSKNALRIYKPFTCRDNSNLLYYQQQQHQHQYQHGKSRCHRQSGARSASPRRCRAVQGQPCRLAGARD